MSLFDGRADLNLFVNPTNLIFHDQSIIKLVPGFGKNSFASLVSGRAFLGSIFGAEFVTRDLSSNE